MKKESLRREISARKKQLEQEIYFLDCLLTQIDSTHAAHSDDSETWLGFVETIGDKDPILELQLKQSQVTFYENSRIKIEVPNAQICEYISIRKTFLCGLVFEHFQQRYSINVTVAGGG